MSDSGRERNDVTAETAGASEATAIAPTNSWRAHVLTLYPEMFPGPLDVSVIGNARAMGLWSLSVHDIR
ncbi:MAG: hypothetical protein AAFZ05_05600, partial [Pseudomonadota bacterium]